MIEYVMGNRKPEYDLGDMSYKGKLRNQVLTILYIVYLQDTLWDTKRFITKGAKVETGEHFPRIL